MTDFSQDQPPAARRVFIKTYGCQMNVYDSERMGDVLAPLGYQAAPGPDSADLVILNTCHIREKASEKVYSELGVLKKLKDQRRAAGQDLMIAVAGCVAQAEGAEILARQPAVDIVLGPQAVHKLPEMIARVHRSAGKAIETRFDFVDKFDLLPQARTVNGPSAFVSVQEGCDKFCTFCVVPYTRGAEYSRPVAAVIAETRALAAQGAREIVFLGQNVNAYHGAAPDSAGGTWSLAQLIGHAAKIGGIERLRFTTSHPCDMQDDLIELFGREPKLAPYLHLPVQAGSDRVLKAMNRKHNADDYRAIIAKVRAARPDVAIASDFIVGFPGETEADFEATLQLVRDIGFASAFSFKYSRRPGTPAAEMHGQITPEVQDARLQKLQALLAEQQRRFNGSMIGKTMPVLIDGAGRHPGQIHGRSPYGQAVHIDAASAPIGAILSVEIVSATQNGLGARLIAVEAEDARGPFL